MILGKDIQEKTPIIIVVLDFTSTNTEITRRTSRAQNATGIPKKRHKVFKTMFTLYGVAFAPARKLYQIGFLFPHKNGDFGAISVTERSCASPISKVESHISYRCSHYNG